MTQRTKYSCCHLWSVSHVKTWPSSSFSQNLLLAEQYAGLRSNQPCILEHTPLACEMYVCDRNQRAGHLRQFGKVAQNALLMLSRVWRKMALDVHRSVPGMQSSAVKCAWTQSSRYNRPSNKSVEGLGSAKDNRGSAIGVVYHTLNSLQIWWTAGETNALDGTGVFRSAFQIAHTPADASPNKIRN